MSRRLGMVVVCVVAGVVASGCSTTMSWAASAIFGVPVSEECSGYLDERQAEIEQQASIAKVFLKETATQVQVDAIRARAESLDGVESVSYTSKAEALERAKELFKDSPEVMQDLPGNPFPASVDIQFETRPDADQLEEVLGGMEGVDQLGAGGEKAERALEVMRSGAAGRDCHEFMDEMNKDEERS